MPLNLTQYLTEGHDHCYDVQNGGLHLVTAMPRITVSYSARYDAYFEYMGDEYLEGDEVAISAPVLIL